MHSVFNLLIRPIYDTYGLDFTPHVRFLPFFLLFPILQETKRLLRGDLADQWQAYLIPESEYAWKQLSSQATVDKLRGVMERLSGKKGGTTAGAKSKL